MMSSRSPIVAWLLVAANVCADLVAMSWMQPATRGELSEVVFFALLVGQLSVLCVWCGLRPTVNLWTRTVPFAGVIASALAFGFIDAGLILNFLPFFGLQAALLLALLWAFRRTAYWRRQTGIQTSWQFTVAQLLVVMTAVALLAAALRNGSVFDSVDNWLAIAFLVGSVVLAMASIVVWRLPRHWLLRFAGVLAIAIGFGAAFYIEDGFMMWYATVHFLVQAVVLSVWLGWGGMLPVRHSGDAARTATS
jgi:hypothetical protein